MSNQIKKTVGSHSVDLLSKTPETRSPLELEYEMHKDYEQHVIDCCEQNKKVFTGDFFIVVITKKERILQNVIRNYFLARSSCPTPEWDQAVYRYDAISDSLTFLWVVPSKDTCELFMENRTQITPSELGLLKYVLEFMDGSLMALAKKFNGEVQAPGIRLDA